MKTNSLISVKLAAVFLLVLGTAVGKAQDVTIKNNGKTTSIHANGGNVSVSTNERGRSGQRTRITTKTATGGRGRDITLVQNRQRLTYALNGETLTVSGNYNDIVVEGTCGTLVVDGNHNIIRVQSARSIESPGNKNQITWHSGDPSIDNSGSDNSVSRD